MYYAVNFVNGNALSTFILSDESLRQAISLYADRKPIFIRVHDPIRGREDLKFRDYVILPENYWHITYAPAGEKPEVGWGEAQGRMYELPQE
jgi:hypothetical protein